MRTLLVVLLVAVLAGAGAFWFLTAPAATAIAVPDDHAPDPERGEYIFFATGCAGCHAEPDQDDPLRLSGGLELDTPFGVFRAPNISSHPEDGIGNWSTEDFVNAMVRGVSPEGRHYYPAFPYTTYQRMERADVLDLKAFLDTVPAISGGPEEHDLAFPFNVRRGIGLWKMLYLDDASFAPDPELDETEARGAYLVETMAHCGECHTPRDALGGPDQSRRFAGGPNPAGDGGIPNITPHEDGIGAWSRSDVAYALETGFDPDFDSFGGSMARVVRNMARLTEEDREAIAAYLETVEPLPDAD